MQLTLFDIDKLEKRKILIHSNDGTRFFLFDTNVENLFIGKGDEYNVLIKRDLDCICGYRIIY